MSLILLVRQLTRPHLPAPMYYFKELVIPETIFTVVTTLFIYRLLLYIDRRITEFENGRDTTIV